MKLAELLLLRMVDFTSSSTVFQSYQDHGTVIMKSSCNGTQFMVIKDRV